MVLTPAAVGESPDSRLLGVPYSPLYDDVYAPHADAWAQAQRVFMAGNGLPQRWQARSHFVILEAGFGLGNSFMATWAAWLADPQRCPHLTFISLDKHPLTATEMARVHQLDQPDAGVSLACSASQQRQLAMRLHAAWPTLTAGLHTLHFDEPVAPNGIAPRMTLLLALGDIAELLPAILAQVDAFYLDGFDPAKNPQMWDKGLLSRLNRLAAPGATVAARFSTRAVCEALTQAGFQIEHASDTSGQPLGIKGTYLPRYVAPPQIGGIWPTPPRVDQHAIVLGAGLAGCSAALALCQRGWRVTLLDQHAAPASEASGNPGGLFHSILHGEDGIHARAHRAAALAAWRQIKPLVDAQDVLGQCKGLLRLDAKISDDAARTLLRRQGLPEDHVVWLSQADAQACSGLDVPSGGWLFQQGGWVHPAGYAQHLLRWAAQCLDGEGRPLLTCLWRTRVEQLQRTDQGAWWACDDAGQSLACAPTLVLTNANDASRLLTTLPTAHAVSPLPLTSIRGQISALTTNPDGHVTLPHLPVAGSGYVLPLPDGRLLCGATTQIDDTDPSVRAADHRHNLGQAERLGALTSGQSEISLPADLQGRVGWRASTPDRLPIVGAMPWSTERLAMVTNKTRFDQVRLIPRQRDAHGGLYALTGLGSRGLTWAALAAELLAHWVTGSPCPVESDLRDALDPARFVARQNRI
jgi:tRNA 5-methylaminomethyl-2-thiouridine biosynthesis bifunctional protein